MKTPTDEQIRKALMRWAGLEAYSMKVQRSGLQSDWEKIPKAKYAEGRAVESLLRLGRALLEEKRQKLQAG